MGLCRTGTLARQFERMLDRLLTFGERPQNKKPAHKIRPQRGAQGLTGRFSESDKPRHSASGPRF